MGDFVQLLSDDRIPADMLLLQSSDPGGICYIETANIDGETNLKQRQVAPGSLSTGADDNACVEGPGVEPGKKFDPLSLKGEVYCEQPHKKIYDFNGYM